MHNQIAQPNRAVDNSTIWTTNFSPAHNEDLFNGSGESMKGFYEQLSSGKYSVTNTVSDGFRCRTTRPTTATTRSRTTAAPGQFIEDSGNAWFRDALATR